MFDFTVAGQNPPDPPAPTSSGNGSSNARAAASTSKRKPARLRTRAILCQQYGLTPAEHDDLTYEMIDALVRVMNNDSGVS